MESDTVVKAEPNQEHSAITENGITIKKSSDTSVGKYNPKLAVLRELVLATVDSCAKEHTTKQSALMSSEDGKRQFFACDLIAQSGMAGLQWKKHAGDRIHVTLAEQRELTLLQGNAQANGFTLTSLPLSPERPASMLLPEQGSAELHLAQCDPLVLMQLESFDFVYVDPHKNPAPYLSSLFRTVRNGGVVCVVVPDTMHFARSPHVVRRTYGAHCMKTEYLKELAVRIILATLAAEAAKCNKALTVLYAVSLEDFLLVAVRVARGPRLADTMLQHSIGHLLHCRICEERGFCRFSMAPEEDPYAVITCDCRRKVPGKTGVILGPLWKGSLYEFSCLSSLAASGHALKLSPSFFSLLQRVMEDCLCDAPPSLHTLRQGLSHHDHLPLSGTGDVGDTVADPTQTCTDRSGRGQENGDGGGGDQTQRDRAVTCDPEKCETSLPKDAGNAGVAVLDDDGQCPTREPLKDVPVADTAAGEPRGLKRPAPVAGAEESKLPQKRSKGTTDPAPCFFYNMHSKRLGTNRLPKHHAIVERLRAHGYRSCRTHFEKYAIRTDADLKTLTALLGTSENKVLYVKGSEQTVKTE
ncbi:uncharacterized protein LOC143301339 [Babylonia areolata]|uniref:uncharacterized protein LOC143301339 n=1 Tax=Babylonia areolata TaxID=304850 RepID=UPI003FD2D4D4